MGTAKWVTVSGFCETSGAANEEQRLHRRMSFGSQLNIAIIRWTLLPLLHFHPAWKSHTSLELMQAIWWHVIVFFFFFYHISVRLAGSCHDLGWVDYLIGGLKCVKCVCVIWHVPCQITNFKKYIPWTWTSFRDSQVTSTPWAGGYTKTITSTASPWRIEAAETYGLFRMTRC